MNTEKKVMTIQEAAEARYPHAKENLVCHLDTNSIQDVCRTSYITGATDYLENGLRFAEWVVSNHYERLVRPHDGWLVNGQFKTTSELFDLFMGK